MPRNAKKIAQLADVLEQPNVDKARRFAYVLERLCGEPPPLHLCTAWFVRYNDELIAWIAEHQPFSWVLAADIARAAESIADPDAAP